MTDAELRKRLLSLNPWSDMDWPEVIREAAAALSRLGTELAEEQARCHDNRLIADAAYERAEKAEARIAELRVALAEAERERTDSPFIDLEFNRRRCNASDQE